MMAMRITVEPGAKVPERKYDTDAGLDFFAPYSVTLSPGQRETIDTGICIELPENTFGRITGRSGLAKQHGIEVFPGTIDEGYRGRIGITLQNRSSETYRIISGDKIAQLIVIPCVYVRPLVVDKLTETERGEKGFGSSGY